MSQEFSEPSPGGANSAQSVVQSAHSAVGEIHTEPVAGKQMNDAKIMDSPWPDKKAATPSTQVDLPDAALLTARSLVRQLIFNQIPDWNADTPVPGPDLLIIEAPERWLSVLADAVPDVFAGSNPSNPTPEGDNVGSSQNSLADTIDFRRESKRYGNRRHKSEGSVAVFRQPQDDTDRRAGLLNELVNRSLRQRQKVVIVATPDPGSLPSVIRNAADAIWRLPEPDEKWLSGFAAEITGDLTLDSEREVVDGVSPAIAKLKASVQPEAKAKFDPTDLKPDILQLAVRAGQSAKDFLFRTKKLVAAGKAPAPKPASFLITLEDLHGLEEFVIWAKALAVDLTEYKKGQLPWSEVDPGVLLAGPPGTGKTMAAQAAARYCQVNFVATSYSAWQAEDEGHLGDVIGAIRNVFKHAKNKAPSLLFLDELDSVGSRQNSSGHKEWWRSIVNALLEELDGVGGRDGVVVIGATNHPAAIDTAIRRAGRMDRFIEVRLPNAEALDKIYKFYIESELKNIPLSGEAWADDHFKHLAALSLGYSGADVTRVIRNAKRHARSGERSLEFNDVFQELRGSDLTEFSGELQRRIAVHEAGHAVALTLQKPKSPPTVRLGGLGHSGGGISHTISRHAIFTAKEVDELLIVALAGRAAEELICGQPSSGAGGSPSSDVAKATRIAALAETNWALGRLGLAWSDMGDTPNLDTLLAMRPGAFAAVHERLDTAYDSAKRIIAANRETVLLLTDLLLERRLLLPGEVADIVSGINRSETIYPTIS